MDIAHFTGVLKARWNDPVTGDRVYQWVTDGGVKRKTRGIPLQNEVQGGRYSVITQSGLHGEELWFATYHPAPIPRPQQRRGNRPTWHQYCRQTPRWGNDEWEAA